MNNMRNKILSLLVLLLTAASGAWAQSYEAKVFDVPASWAKDETYLSAADLPKDFVQITKDEAKALAVPDGTVLLIYGFEGENIKVLIFFNGTLIPDEDDDGAPEVRGMFVQYQTDANIIICYPAPGGPKVAWDAATKTGTFSMPGSDVVLTPQYAPVAKWDVVETVPQLPAALEGIIAGQDAAIVTAGQSAQGTVMYAVTTTAEAAPALTAFSATVPTAKTYDDATTLYVWYYIQGHDTPDGEPATEENTFNDSEISAAPLKVDILTNKFDLTLKPAPVKNMTVTVAGQAKTPTDEGKVEAVKMQSEVKLKAATGYKFRKVEVKKTPKQ